MKLCEGRGPARDVRVLLLPRGTEPDILAFSANVNVSGRKVARPRWVTTDEQGRYRLEHVASGAYTLRAWCNAWLSVDFATVEIGVEDRSRELDAELPLCGRLRGRWSALPDGAQPLDVIVHGLPPNSVVAGEAFTSMRGIRLEVAADGSFDFGWVPAGRVELQGSLDEGNQPFAVGPRFVDIAPGADV